MKRALLVLVTAAVATAPLSALAATLGLTTADGSPARSAVSAAADALDVKPDEVEPLAILPGDGWYALGLSMTICEGEAVAELGTTIASAKMQLEGLQSAQAMAGLDAAIEAQPCAAFAVDTEVLAQALDLLGQAAQDESKADVARLAYQRLLAIAPSHRLSSPPGTGYEVLWEEVRREVLAAGVATLAVQHDIGKVWLDGGPVKADWSGTLKLVPGRHLLQWTADGATTGAWIELADGATKAALVDAAVGYANLLAEGPSDSGRKMALELWLGELAATFDMEGVAVVLEETPYSGYAVRDGKSFAWQGSARTPGQAGAADRLRIALGGGWMFAGGASFGDIALAADVRLIGPLHLHVDADVGITRPIELPGSTIDGARAVLPGFGVGVALRPAAGFAQPFVSLSLGMWVVPSSYTEEAVDQVGRFGDAMSRAQVDSRGPVTFRGFLDGGIDLVLDRVVSVRLTGGVGYGFGFQARAGSQVALRFGRMGGTP
jgi:hypothetical protein